LIFDRHFQRRRKFGDRQGLDDVEHVKRRVAPLRDARRLMERHFGTGGEVHSDQN
jgi:hypothetical protein